MLMKQKTSRRAVQMVFLVSCVGTTAAVAGWAAWMRHADHGRRYADSLSRHFSTSVRIHQTEHLQPGKIRHTAFELPSLSGSQINLSAVSVTVHRHRAWCEIDVPELRVRQEAFPEFWKLALRCAHLSGDGTAVPWRFHADRVIVQHHGQELTLHDVKAGLESSDEQSRIWFEFEPAENSADTPARLRLTIPQTASNSRRLDVNTHGHALPAWLFHGIWSWGSAFGEQAAWQGGVHVTWHGSRWRVQAAKGTTWHEVPLQETLAAWLGGQCSGQASLRLNTAVWDGERLDHAVGRLETDAGAVNSQFLTQAAQLLGPTRPAVRAGTQGLAFRRLAVDFELNENGLALLGGCEPSKRAMMIAQDGSALLQVNPGRPLEWEKLIGARVPPGTPRIPATETALRAWKRLPMDK